MSSFHERIRRLREESGKTQAQIAEDLGMTPQAFSYIMKGREPNFELLARMAAYFGVTADYLLGLQDNRAPENVRIGEALGLSDLAIDNMRAATRGLPERERILDSLLGSPHLDALLDELGQYLPATERRMRYIEEKQRFGENVLDAVDVTDEPAAEDLLRRVDSVVDAAGPGTVVLTPVGAQRYYKGCASEAFMKILDFMEEEIETAAGSEWIKRFDSTKQLVALVRRDQAATIRRHLDWLRRKKEIEAGEG